MFTVVLQAGSPDNDMSPPASAPQPAIHDDDEEEEEDGIEGVYDEVWGKAGD